MKEPESLLPHDPVRHLSTDALVFLRGRDADGRLRELEALRRASRPVLGALAVPLVEKSFFEGLGYRSLGDYAREHLGVGARCVREWARVWRALEGLSLLREAVLAGEIGWGIARLVVGLATPDTEAACLETVRGRTMRAVEAIVHAVRGAEGRARDPDEAAEAEADEEREVVRLACTPAEAGMWNAAVELARRSAGEELAPWQCAERIAAEAASAIGAEELPGTARCSGSGGEGARKRRAGWKQESPPSGLREEAYPHARCRMACGEAPEQLTELTAGLDECSPREVDRRLRAATAFLQSVDFEIGRILRQMQDRKLFEEIGFAGLAEYAREQFDLSARTAQRLVALARAEHRAPSAATAFREGRITAFQAQAIANAVIAQPEIANAEVCPTDLPSADVDMKPDAAPGVERAQQVTLRRLEKDLTAVPRASIAFSAPREVARFFLAMVRCVGLARLLAHAIREWIRQGEQFRDYADFERDEFRCTAPGCTARRNLHSHHIWYRGRCGPDVAWNRTTLCAYHHERALHHQGSFRVSGRAPDEIFFELGSDRGERFRSGDVRC